MSDRILQLTTFEIDPGQLAAFKGAITKAVAFARDNGPQLMVAVYIDATAMRAQSCQIQPDSAAILRHWRLADPHIAAVMACSTLTRIEVFGDPSSAVIDGLRPLARQGVAITITPGFTGFARHWGGPQAAG